MSKNDSVNLATFGHTMPVNWPVSRPRRNAGYTPPTDLRSSSLPQNQLSPCVSIQSVSSNEVLAEEILPQKSETEYCDAHPQENRTITAYTCFKMFDTSCLLSTTLPVRKLFRIERPVKGKDD